MEKIKVWVKTELGLKGSEQIEADPTEKIGTLKKRIASKWAFDPKNTVLMHNGEVLDESQKLKDYGIQENETLHVTPKHAPGAAHMQTASLRGLSPDLFSKRISRESQMIRLQDLPIKPLNPQRWVMRVSATKGPWKGRLYDVLIELSHDYPFRCPRAKWLSKKSMIPDHPNIFPRTGYICFYMFKMKGWRPQYNLITCYYGIRWLLENPNFEDRYSFDRFISYLRVHNMIGRMR
jgi:ubiquitin-protein ligase